MRFVGFDVQAEPQQSFEAKASELGHAITIVRIQVDKTIAQMVKLVCVHDPARDRSVRLRGGPLVYEPTGPIPIAAGGAVCLRGRNTTPIRVRVRAYAWDSWEGLSEVVVD